MKLAKAYFNGLQFWYREDDRYVGQRVALGKYEVYETKIMLRQIRSDGVVVDVGANIGYYTLLMAQKAKKVYAIEPDPDNFAILKKNVEINNLKNVVLINAAAGDKNGQYFLIKDPENYGNSRISLQKGIKINCLRLDDILINEQKISLIKSDTQGWEPAVIGGAVEIIKRDSPTLFLEYWPEGVSKTKYDLRNMIYELKKTYKIIWQIDEELWIYKKVKEKITVNPKTGYADLWMKKRPTLIDYISQNWNIRVRKLFKKAIMNYVND